MRQEVGKISKKSMQLPTIRKVHFKTEHIIVAIVVLLLAIFFIRVALWEHAYINRMEGSERATAEQVGIATEGEEVDETVPTETETAEYTVAPDRPRYFSIPSLNIHNARIVEVGMKANGQISTPYNIWDVGWYNQSSLPGDGVSFMDGHGGAPGIAAFGSLPRIKIGAEITIEMGDGQLYTYKVVETATKPLGDEADEYMATALTSPERGTPALSLVTCTGDFWLSQQTYSHRFFVRAILDDSL